MRTVAQYRNTRMWSGSKSVVVPFSLIIVASHLKSTRNRPYRQGWQALVRLIAVVVNSLATKAVEASIKSHFIRVVSLRSEAASFVLSNRTQTWIRALLHLYSSSLSTSTVFLELITKKMALASTIYLPGESDKVSKEVDRTFRCTPTRITASNFIISLLIS